MRTVLNLVAVGAVGALLLGKIKLRTALVVGVGAVMIGSVMPTQPSSTATTTA